MAEYLDVIDENGNVTGEVVDRKVAHDEGIRHRASHLWLVRKKNGKIQVLLQRRSSNKEAFPNCYDISSAGHVPAGDDFETSAIRELNEELGICANKKDLIFCGMYGMCGKQFIPPLYCNRRTANIKESIGIINSFS